MNYAIIIVLLSISSKYYTDDKLVLLNDNCVRCHLTCERSGENNSVLGWKDSVHFRQGTGCADCHGGNRLLYLDFKKGHMGRPKQDEVSSICRQCHQYEYNKIKIRNLRKTLDGSLCKANCVVCHGNHNIKAADATCISNKNCSKCHSADNVRQIVDSINLVEIKIQYIEKRIEQRTMKKYPAEGFIRDLERIKTEFGFLFHERTMKELEKNIIFDTLTSIDELEMDLNKTAPKNWYIQGVVVIFFLLFCLAVTIYVRIKLLPV